MTRYLITIISEQKIECHLSRNKRKTIVFLELHIGASIVPVYVLGYLFKEMIHLKRDLRIQPMSYSVVHNIKN